MCERKLVWLELSEWWEMGEVAEQGPNHTGLVVQGRD